MDKFDNIHNSSPMDFMEQIHRFGMAIHRSRPVNDLNMNMFSTLVAIKKISKKTGDDGVLVGTLTEFLEQTKPAISQKLNILEKKEYIVRVQSKEDRRYTKIYLTESGKSILRDMKCQFNRYLIELEKTMGEEKLTTLTQLLKEAVDNINLIVMEDSECSN